MIVLFTDFGWHDPYVGQLKGRLATLAPGETLVDLLHAVPDFNAHAGAHLLAALHGEFPPGSVFLCVVDPGVGSPREAMVTEADGRWYVGPDNGLLSILAARADQARHWRIHWQPARLSDTFHGRDLFAPIAAAIAGGNFPEDRLTPLVTPEVLFDPADLPRIIYLDHYGNAWTGIRGGLLEDVEAIEAKGHRLPRQRTFGDAAKGEAFWYVNSAGLAEIAVNRGSAADKLGLALGDPVRLSGLPGSRSH